MTYVSMLAIDPGVATGWAYFRDGRLLFCGACTPDDTIRAPNPELVVIEFPRIYMKSTASTDDILSLARKCGRYEERYTVAGADIEFVRPSDWKGSIAKAVMTKRIEDALTPEERAVVSRYDGLSSRRHDMLDALGMGKWWIARAGVRAKLDEVRARVARK